MDNEAAERLARATQRISKSLAPDDSNLAEASYNGSSRIANAITGDGIPYGLAEAVLMAFGHGGVGGDPTGLNLVGGLYAIASSIDRLADAVENATGGRS